MLFRFVGLLLRQYITSWHQLGFKFVCFCLFVANGTSALLRLSVPKIVAIKIFQVQVTLACHALCTKPIKIDLPVWIYLPESKVITNVLFDWCWTHEDRQRRCNQTDLGVSRFTCGVCSDELSRPPGVQFDVTGLLRNCIVNQIFQLYNDHNQYSITNDQTISIALWCRAHYC